MRFLKSCFVLGLLCFVTQLSFAGDVQWVEIKSPNFSVITDAGDKRGREVAFHFEQMRSVFGTLMAKANVNLSVPLQIVAFKNTKEIRQMAPVYNGKLTEVAGLFQGGDDRTFIMLDMSVDNPWTIVFHEYAHQLMNSNLTVHTDPWFEEGFAEYFSSIEVDNKEANVGKIPEETYQVLGQMGMMKSANLLRVQQYSDTYNRTGASRDVFYEESGLLVHYIYDNQLILKLADYFDGRVNQKLTVDQAWQKAFGMTLEMLDKNLHNYLSSNHFRYYRIPSPAGVVAANFTIAPISLSDAHTVLADIDAHSLDHHDRALDEFQEVLQSDPNNASALRGVGYIYLIKQDYGHAGEYFKRAAAQNSKDPRVHYYNALLMNRSAGGRIDGKDTSEMKKELETAIVLDPKLADAYSLLAFAQAFSGEQEKAMETMKKALELSPRNENYQMNMVNIYMANHKFDPAIELLSGLTLSSNTAIASQASMMLAQAQNIKQNGQSFQLRVEDESGSHVADRVVTHVPMDNTSGTVEAKIEVETPPAPVHFLKGKLVSVDCSAEPQAWLNVVSGSHKLKLHVSDRKHLVLMGADQFSCDWKNKTVAFNYRERKDGDGDVVSLEMQ